VNRTIQHYQQAIKQKEQKQTSMADKMSLNVWRGERATIEYRLERLINHDPYNYAEWISLMKELKLVMANFASLFTPELRRETMQLFKSPSTLIAQYKDRITPELYLLHIGSAEVLQENEIDDDDIQDDKTSDTSRKEDKSTYVSDTDSEDGDLVPELSFGLSDLTQPFETSHEKQAAYREQYNYIGLEPLASIQMHNVQLLVWTLEYMLQFPTPTQDQIYLVKSKWDAVMLDYNTTEQKFEVKYAALGFKQSGVNIFINYVQFLLGYKIELSKKVGC